MERLRSRPGITSVVGGILFGLVLLVVGGGDLTPVKFGLAAFLGIVFAVSMYAGFQRRRA